MGHNRFYVLTGSRMYHLNYYHQNGIKFLYSWTSLFWVTLQWQYKCCGIPLETYISLIGSDLKYHFSLSVIQQNLSLETVLNAIKWSQNMWSPIGAILNSAQWKAFCIEKAHSTDGSILRCTSKTGFTAPVNLSWAFTLSSEYRIKLRWHQLGLKILGKERCDYVCKI